MQLFAHVSLEPPRPLKKSGLVTGKQCRFYHNSLERSISHSRMSGYLFLLSFIEVSVCKANSVHVSFCGVFIVLFEVNFLSSSHLQSVYMFAA